jgi:hypothetical protein
MKEFVGIWLLLSHICKAITIKEIILLLVSFFQSGKSGAMVEVTEKQIMVPCLKNLHFDLGLL